MTKPAQSKFLKAYSGNSWCGLTVGHPVNFLVDGLTINIKDKIKKKKKKLKNQTCRLRAPTAKTTRWLCWYSSKYSQITSLFGNLMIVGYCIFLSVGNCDTSYFLYHNNHRPDFSFSSHIGLFLVIFGLWSNTKEKATWKQSSNPLVCSFAYIHSSYTLILHVYTKYCT